MVQQSGSGKSTALVIEHIYEYQTAGDAGHVAAPGMDGTDGSANIYENCAEAYDMPTASRPKLYSSINDESDCDDRTVPPQPATTACPSIHDSDEPSSANIYESFSMLPSEGRSEDSDQRRYENCAGEAGLSVLDQAVDIASAVWELQCRAENISTGTVAHQSQLDCEEPSYQKVPSWRREELEASLDQKISSLSPRQLRRFMAQEAARQVNADRVLELVAVAANIGDLADKAQGGGVNLRPDAELVAKWLRAARAPDEFTASRLDRAGAARLLRESGLGEGTFCFRKSKSKGMVVLCVLSANQQVANIRLEPKLDSGMIEVHDLKTPLRLPTIQAVLDHFSDLANQPNNSVPLGTCLPESTLPACDARVASG